MLEVLGRYSRSEALHSTCAFKPLFAVNVQVLKEEGERPEGERQKVGRRRHRDRESCVKGVTMSFF